MGACIPPNVEDVDCPGGTGNGPAFAETVNFSVVGFDVYGLDRDNDGIACESSGADNGSRDGITTAGVSPSPGMVWAPTAQPAGTTQRALARTGQGNGRQVQLALVFVLLGLALVIAPGALLLPKRHMD